MNNCEDRWVLNGLQEMKGIGWATISKIMLSGARLHELPDYKLADWQGIGFSKEKAHRFMEQLTVERIEHCRETLRDKKIEIVTSLDMDYPPLLKEINQPPWVLYCQGQKELLHTRGIAIVGTRVPTAYGRKVSQMFSEGLCQGGMTVISGLARGIDSVCHEAALACGGHTIAVMGTGMDLIYPAENRSLFGRIVERGLIVTEYPLGTPSHPGLFPQRNRIIAGLAVGTLVAEADFRSGSLITADFALEASRDVFAIPGPITSPKSQGTLSLIKQGAKLVTSSSDIIEEYDSWEPNMFDELYGKGQQNGKSELLGYENLTTEERELYHVLEQGASTLDELIETTKWDFGHLHSVLLSLIIKKQIIQLPGAIYKTI